MKILFVHPSGAYGGASKSLIEHWNVLHEYSIEGVVICPNGSAASAFADAGLKVLTTKGIAQLDNTRYGYYRGARWLILLRELALFPVTWWNFRKTLKGNNFDIVHLNEVTLLPWALALRRWSDARIVVHVRSLQRGSSNDFRSRWLNRIILNSVDLIVAIDESVRRTLAPSVPVSIVRNGFRVNNSKASTNLTSARRHHKRNVFRVGIVGVLLKLKGVYEFIEAARILVNERHLNIEFYIVGENARELIGWRGTLLRLFDFAHDVKADLKESIAKHHLSDNVRLLGFVSNVQQIYEEIDLLCFPSHLDAAGRPVFEAAFHGVPSIVAVKNPTADTIVDGETGICIPYSDAMLLADSIEDLYQNRSKLITLGQKAKRLAERNFDAEQNAKKLLEIYDNLVRKNELEHPI